MKTEHTGWGCRQILPMNNCGSWDPELKVIFSLIQDVKR